MTAPTRSRSEELLDLAQEAGGLGLFEWDIAQARITLSPRYLAIHGLDAFDGRYESWLSCIHREDRVRIAHLVDSVFADKRREWHAEYRIVGADSGELKWLEARNIVAYGEDGAPRRVVGVIVDVTQHKRSTAALQAFAETLEETVRDRTARLHASEGLIATFFRHSPECHAVMVEAGEGRFRYEEVNPATLQLYNMARQDVVGFTVDELFGAEAAGELDAHLTACLRSGLPHRYERVQGQSCVEAIATPVPQEPGALRRIVVSARDVTERRRLEDQLRQTQKMEAIGQLTGGVAHDFNNLLTIVMGGLDMIGRQVGSLPSSPATARIARGKDMALEGVQRAAALTSRLLAFSRRQPLAPKLVDPNRLILDICDLLNRTLGETVQLETVLAAGIWRTETDPNQLENAVLNLALNARDAMPDGGKVTLETANCYLDRTYLDGLNEPVEEGQYVMIAVTDTGCGMERSTVERAFDPFYTTKGVGKGTGLGLSQVYGFVRQSSGHVKIYSEPGQGTSVKIYLRRSAATGDRLTPETSALRAADRAVGRERILVVEDDDALRSYSVDILRELGYDVIEASNGAEALETLDGCEFDLLFTDVVMPGMNGRQLADEALRRRPGLMVLFTTGYTRNAIVHHGRLDAGTHMIGKPFSFDELGAKVRAMLDGGISAG